MKKLISILSLAFIISLFSSCIMWINPDNYQTGSSTNTNTKRYSITCHNESDTIITDWCVVKNGTVTYAKNKYESCPIAANGGTSTLTSLPEGEYYLYVAFNPDPSYDDGDYVQSKRINLNKNYDVYVDQTFVDELF